MSKVILENEPKGVNPQEGLTYSTENNQTK